MDVKECCRGTDCQIEFRMCFVLVVQDPTYCNVQINAQVLLFSASPSVCLEMAGLGGLTHLKKNTHTRPEGLVILENSKLSS